MPTRARIRWDGRKFVLSGYNRYNVSLPASGGGVHPDFRAEEVARTRNRPPTPTDHSPASVVEIAAVAVEGYRMEWLYFLDEASRRLTAYPVAGLTEDGLAGLARHVGIGFCVYWISLGEYGEQYRGSGGLRYEQGRISPLEVIDAVFPESARWQEMLL